MANYYECPMCGATGPVGADWTMCSCALKAAMYIYVKEPHVIKLDAAAAAFHAADGTLTVRADSGDVDTFRVIHENGTLVQSGMTFDDATALRNQEAGRAGVIAVIREIVSPTMIQYAGKVSAVSLYKDANNSLNHGRKPSLALLEGLVYLLEQDGKRGDPM